MNEQQNVALIQKLYSAFSRGDIQTILDNVTPDVEWILEGPEIIPFAGKRTGPDQVRGFFTALGSTQSDQKLTIDDYIAQGDKVAAVGRYSAVVTATGKKLNSAAAHIFTIRDGKVSRFLDFGDTAQAADAYTTTRAASR
jgi:ketosteroid isomerase-like protein